MAATTEEILAALQNRINELEVKIQGYEKERNENKAGAEVTRLDKLIAELKADITELREKKKDLEADDKDKDKKGEGGGILDDLNTLALDE